MDLINVLSQEFGIKPAQVEATVKLIDEGNTIPFIARYRKEVTGGLSDVVLRDMDDRITYLRNLENRKEEVARLIDEQGKLTPELKAQIEEAQVLQRVEDLYKPFKKKKATKASKAREKGLQPLADIIRAQEIESGDPLEQAAGFVDPEKGVESAADALRGACDIIAEEISDSPELTDAIRTATAETAVIITEAADPEEKTVYEMYYDFREGASKIPNHRILAINRGEKEKKLKVNIICECPDENAIAALVAEDFGIALVARVDAVDQANVTVLPLADADLTHTVYMGYIRDKYQIPAVKRFIQFVKRDGKAY